MKPFSRIKQLIYIDREYTEEIRDVRETILKGVMYVCAVIGLPAVLIGSVDSFKQGQWYFGLIYIGVYLPIPLFILLARKIPYGVRAMLPLLIHIVLSISILLRIGLSGVGSELMIGAAVLATMLYGLRSGIITMAAGIAIFTTVGTLMITGIIPLNPVTMLNSASPTSWTATILSFIIITSILALSPVLFQNKLHESLEQYRHLVTYAPAGICEIDLATGKFSFVNDVICAYTGYRREELLSMSPSELIPGTDVLVHLERLGRIMEGNDPSASAEYQVVSKTGKKWDILVQPRYTYRDRRVVRAMFVIHDISERKKWERELMASLKEKEILLKEIHHRVKNNMQVISSLLSLQSGHIHDERDAKIFTAMQGRVRSMAAVHEKLYQTENLTSIDMGDFVKGLASQISMLSAAHSADIEMVVEIRGIFFTIERAIPCSLIINELVSNAFEHAFPGGRKGTITVSIREPVPGSYELTVEDDGEGLPAGVDPARTDTLGMKLVHALARQMNGTISFTRGRGTRCTITF